MDPEDEVPLAEYLRVFERSIELVDGNARCRERRLRMRPCRAAASIRHVTSRVDGVDDGGIPTRRHAIAARERQHAIDATPRAAEANLDDVLRIFKRGRGHLALVLGQPRKSSMVESDCLSPLHGTDKSFIVGLVTLEDIIEEILGDEIIDETDVYVDVDNHVKVDGQVEIRLY